VAVGGTAVGGAEVGGSAVGAGVLAGPQAVDTKISKRRLVRASNGKDLLCVILRFLFESYGWYRQAERPNSKRLPYIGLLSGTSVFRKHESHTTIN
jgi:hypothetical protein